MSGIRRARSQPSEQHGCGVRGTTNSGLVVGAFCRVGGQWIRELAEELRALLHHSPTPGVKGGAHGSSEHGHSPTPRHYTVCPPDPLCGTWVTLPVGFLAPEPAVLAGVGAQRHQNFMSLEESLTCGSWGHV